MGFWIVEDLIVEATGPFISQDMSATVRILNNVDLTSYLVNRYGDPWA